MPIALWKKFKEFPNYEISWRGEVRNANKRLLAKHFYEKSGYYVVTLRNKNIKRSYSVHKLVALLFVPNPDNYQFVVHKDNNKTNNVYTNLKWICENELYKRQRRRESNLSPDIVKEIKKRLLAGETGVILANQYNTSEMTISRISKRLKKELERSVTNKETVEYLSGKIKKTQSWANFNWTDFILQQLNTEKIILANRDLIELAKTKYELSIENKFLASSQMQSVIKRLIELKIINRVKIKNKQWHYYALSGWFDNEGNLLNEYIPAI